MDRRQTMSYYTKISFCEFLRLSTISLIFSRHDFVILFCFDRRYCQYTVQSPQLKPIFRRINGSARCFQGCARFISVFFYSSSYFPLFILWCTYSMQRPSWLNLQRLMGEDVLYRNFLSLVFRSMALVLFWLLSYKRNTQTISSLCFNQLWFFRWCTFNTGMKLHDVLKQRLF